MAVSPGDARFVAEGNDLGSVVIANGNDHPVRYCLEPRKVKSGKTDPVQFKGVFKTGPFLLIKMGVLQAVFSS